MGQPDHFAKRTFSEEAERVTGGAVAWQDPPEMRLEKVQCDGLLLVRRPELLATLANPWPEAQGYDEVVVELKMPGDHLDIKTVERTLLRRGVRQVQRAEERDPFWPGDVPLWLVAPHMPEWLKEVRTPVRFAPGCYRVEPLGYCFFWIAANELPLRDELVPFLVARSGRALDEFGLWVAPRRPLEWLLDLLQYTTMSMTVREDIRRRFAPTEDPVIKARRREILQWLLEDTPDVKQELIEQGIEQGLDKGRLVEARALVRSVLTRRQLVLDANDEARLEACANLSTLERWLDQAVTAPSASEALQ